MKPAPAESTAELLHRVRQQLILSQVRIMELEDERDELAPRLAAAPLRFRLSVKLKFKD